MIEPLKFILNRQPKRFGSRKTGKESGFTLIELMVAMTLAVLIITPLMVFVVNLLESDRKAQAKTSREQELQTAINYIARDLEQAVYVYDGTGVEAIKAQIPPTSKATNDPCKDENCQPVLVFWKREQLKEAIPVNEEDSCKNNLEETSKKEEECNDTHVYSLVAYYLIKDTNSTTWSKAARIARFQIRDGAYDPESPSELICDRSPSPCEEKDRRERNKGFKLFDLQGKGKLPAKMNLWKKADDTYTKTTQVLVDYIDKTERAPNDVTPAPTDASCTQVLGIPAPAPPKPLVKTTISDSFYACVDSERNLAQVYIRGNARTRIIDGNPPEYIEYTNKKQSSDFPTVSVQVQGNGFIGGE